MQACWVQTDGDIDFLRQGVLTLRKPIRLLTASGESFTLENESGAGSLGGRIKSVPVYSYGAVLASAAAACVVVYYAAHSERVAARDNYIANSHAELLEVKARVEEQLNQVYRNIRTLALLPGVRKIDRHGSNIDPDTHKTFQQIYNNLADSVSVSEVYIVPESIDPDKIDPVTGKPEEPVMMFDELIVNGGTGAGGHKPKGAGGAKLQPEIEYYEYKQYQQQFAWFRRNVPTEGSISGLSVPMISGQEIITCDNTLYNQTLSDDDRRGITFAVPFYGEDGKLKGSVAAIMLSKALAAALPQKDFALINTTHNYSTAAGTGGQLEDSAAFVVQGKADPGLIYSEVADLHTADSLGNWKLWSGHPDTAFLGNPALQSITLFERLAYGFITILMLAGLMIVRQRGKNRKLADQVNEERLNSVRNLTARVSHELRNPLGIVRNSLFTLRRYMPADRNVERQVDRADRGITRCDQLVADLHEFTRTDPLLMVNAEVGQWLEVLLANESLGAKVDAAVSLPAVPVLTLLDRDRLGRAVINVFRNAVEAVESLGKPGRIDVTLEQKDEYVVICIKDSGPGMAPDVLQKAYDPLFTTKNFGAGLGLPIAREIVTQHGGRIDVATKPGEGTSVTILIPISRPSVQKLAA